MRKSYRYAYIDGKWRQCITPYNEFAGCSERELQLLTTELRQRNHLQYGKERIEVTQKQLAIFRRENTDIETILRQQRHDREMRAALIVLEGDKATREMPPISQLAVERDEQQSTASEETPARPKPYGKLLVLKRIEL